MSERQPPTPTLDELDRGLRTWAADHGIEVRDVALGPETPGSFDGPTVSINPVYDPESQAFILAHSLGSVVVWSLDYARSRATYADLRTAKRSREGLAAALAGWTAHEEAASEYAVGLLLEVGHDWAVPAYTIFARADLEMMLAFHRDGKAPVWPEFFPEWRLGVERGVMQVRAYRPRPIPSGFRPVCIERQEVFREEDGKPDEK